MNFTFPADDSSSFSAKPSACRKRKEFDEADGYGNAMDEAVGLRDSRRWNSGTGAIDQEARFHPLPRELNLQMLANLGYNVNYQKQDVGVERQSSLYNHSPSSSASDFYPSTPNDVVSTLADSYFAKELQTEAGPSPAYPVFDIYPEDNSSRPSGLLGMYMQDDGMDVDGDQKQAGPSHG
ncbi:hypothetical protein CBS101457_004197 [Exobasidium rhododendri]|nr:hypothetical protein CBS101457_004197 [Exobasidium rhododendri]